MTNTDPNQFPNTFEGLLHIVKRLRGPDGCPWDREQTHQSVKNQFLEECYELIEAIEQNNTQKMIEELGDVLFHVVFQAEIADDEGEFAHEQVLESLISKLIRRHPHIFADAQVADAREVETQWEAIKREEKSDTDESTLDGVPKSMPALAYAQEIHRRAARTGFDWDDFQGVLDKVAEEVEELAKAESGAQREEEFGDILLMMVNAARWLDVDAESALRKANAKFYNRFATMERFSRERDLSFSDLSLDEKESLWQEAKRLES